MTSSGPTPMRTTAATDHRCHRARVAPSFSTIGPRRTAAPRRAATTTATATTARALALLARPRRGVRARDRVAGGG